MIKPKKFDELCFVDCEGIGLSPATGEMTEFGAVAWPSGATFYGCDDSKWIFEEFAGWLKEQFGDKRPIFMSDNVAYDWQWINYGFDKHLGHNPFGHSGRRISCYYAGLNGSYKFSQRWKRLRVTPHTHNPVEDAMGNFEAWNRILKGERG